MTRRPQQPEVARSRHTPVDPSRRAAQSGEAELDATEDSPDAVPEENQPGHDHGDDPDKPSPEGFRRRFEGEE